MFESLDCTVSEAKNQNEQNIWPLFTNDLQQKVESSFYGPKRDEGDV